MSTTRELMIEALRREMLNEGFQIPGTPLQVSPPKPILEDFKNHVTGTSGSWHELSSTSEVRPLIRALYPDADIIFSTTPEVKGNVDANRILCPYELNNIDVIIIRAEFGVAENGMVWVAEKNIPVSLHNVLPRHIVVLVDSHRMVRDMREAYEEVYTSENNYGCFMSGLSVSTDEDGKPLLEQKRSFSVFIV